MKNIKIGIIGAGRIGKVHAESIAYKLPQVKIKTIADINVDEAKLVAKQFNIPKYTIDYKEIINDSEIEAVIICSPTNTHSKIIIDAAKKGKHIFCEKPIDLTIEKISETLKVVEENNVKMMVGFNRRFDPNFLKVKNMVKEGRIGNPNLLKITSRDPEPPCKDYIKVSGGLFLDMAIHDFDMARYIVDSEVTEVFSMGEVLIDEGIRDAGDIDTAVTMLKFENGAIGTIDNSRKAIYGYDQRIEIFGSKGMIYINNNKAENHVYINETGEHSSLPLNFFMDRYTESYFQEMKLFVDALVNNSEILANGNDGLNAVKIALAAKKSLQENRPIKLNSLIN
ncbi:MAG: inositol 2-dehydrogenase [Bacteroidetes bacterium]|nr:inositol 2-dehydrogenase [Bacteroidota bacterium]MBU1113597.1 inositol 2-dehydrogenase [Bacteroidota bacterium]MBU1796973.1 inositol 2-dehydrogenase [Bacteroidota bacterium]